MAFLDRALPARPRLSRLPTIPGEAFLLAGVILAAACAVAALFAEPWMYLLLGAFWLCAGIAFYEPRTIGPMLAVALPLEISKLAFPFLQTRAELGGGLPPTSLIDAGRLVIAIAFAVWLLRPGRPRAEVVPASPLVLPLALLWTVYALSAAWAIDPGAARTEALRLLFSLGSFALIPFFVRDRASLRWTLLTFVAMAGALAVVGVWQQSTGEFFWNEGLGLFGERRINTTFADPNHMARFLLEAIVLSMALWFFVGRRTKFAFLLPVMALAMLALVFTGSRGAWVVGAVALPVTVLSLPIERTLRLRLLGLGGALVIAAAVAVSAVNPYFAKRVDTFQLGFDAAGARPYLVDAGLQMFEDHPVAGIGAGGYQAAFEEDYIRFKDPTIKADITISHTSAVTLLAELGLIGLAAFAFVAFRWGLYVRSVLGGANDELRALVGGLAVVIAVIFLGSQTEGRFFEDPFLWFAAGLVVAADAMTRRRLSVAPEPPEQRDQQP